MFIFDCECHMLPQPSDISYYPYYMMNQKAVRNLVYQLEPYTVYGIKEVRSPEETRASRKRRVGKLPGESASALIEKMDEAGITMACVLPESFLPMSNYARMESTNGWLAKELEKYPGRLVGVCNVGPLIYRGIKNAIWEIDYLVKNMNFKAVKFYPADDTPINNKELWPFYEKLQELGVPLFIHTGASWCVPGRSEYCRPSVLEDVCEEFPELTILAYHMGYPYTDELNICALKYPNLYIGTSLLPYFGYGNSRKAQILLGEAIRFAGINKIVWGTDLGPSKDEVDLLQKFNISEQVQKDYGYPPLSEDDRANWAGLNLAKILKVSPPKI